MQKFASDEGQQKIQKRREEKKNLFIALKPKQDLISYSYETFFMHTQTVLESTDTVEFRLTRVFQYGVHEEIAGVVTVHCISSSVSI